MVWLNDKNVELMIRMVKDLENTREVFGGYAYVRTMRNILVGNENAIIACNFIDKPYYGMFAGLTLRETENRMDMIVRSNGLDIIYTEHGKLYCSPEYHDHLCNRKYSA